MTDLDLLYIAESWAPRHDEGSSLVSRRVVLPARLRPAECLVVQGVRRCGKSTLLRQLVSHYGLPPEHCVFLNLEDPRLASALHFETLQALVDAFSARHPDADRLYYFLDEIQGVAGWEKWLRTQLDRPGRAVFVITGSDASLLSGELGSVLTGRHLTVELYPFDLVEYREAVPAGTLTTFLRDGGFPATLANPDGDRLLRQYFNDIVERDIRERVGARSSASVRQVVQMAFESTASELSLRRIAGATGIAVDTVASYLQAAEQAYLLFGVPYFAYSERKQAAYSRKYYPIDTGLRRATITSTGADIGKHLEVATAIALRRRFGHLYYWRGRGEVDFVVRHGDRIVPIQVTAYEPHERHHTALTEFWEHFPNAAEAMFVTLDSFEELLG